MDAAQLVVVTAKIKAPVRRRAGGKLRDSIIAAPAKSRSGKATVRIGPSKKSGISFIGGFMEFGTKFITARPFLRPALRENRRAINAILRTSIGKVVRSRTRGKPKRKKVL